MKIQIWEQNANFAISDSDSHFFHKCIKIAVGRIEQEICAYECTSHNADIRWVKVIAEMFGLDYDFVNRAGDCERSFPSAIMILKESQNHRHLCSPTRTEIDSVLLCDSGVGVYVVVRGEGQQRAVLPILL